MAHDLGAPVDRERLHLLVSDLLQQMEGQADPFLDEVLQRYGVRGLRVVGPLRLATSGREGQRYSLSGIVGGVAIAGTDPRGTVPAGQWLWSVTGVATAGSTPEPWPVGYEPTRLAADRALCLALRELGWAPVEVPTEEEVRASIEAQPLRGPEYLRTDAELRAEVQRGPWAGTLDPYALATATGEDLARLAEQVGVWRQEYQQQPMPARTMEDVVPGINAQLRSDRAGIRRRGQGIDYGIVLDPAASPRARITDDGRGLEFSGLTPVQVEVLQRQMEPISARTRDPALYALLQVVRLPDGTSLWAYLDAADRRLLVREPIILSGDAA
jgi:hypothetical protein